jgi:eukaryotic-like serine/threonine-protein kinase
MTDDRTLPPGTVLNEAYQLTRIVSHGSMGTVYEAVQLRLNRRVAVKIMIPELAENLEALARFRREVKVTSQLSHPHVVQLLDSGSTASGQPYMVTEFLEGEDLERRLIRVGRMALPDVLHIVRQLALALAAIHAKGFVHRDLKPANVFLLPMENGADFVKLVDFGISKVRTSDSGLTKASVVMGTPEYMSPEQASGLVDQVDHSSDQWALAATTWRLLSGRAPFAGIKLNQLLGSIQRDEPPPLDEAGDLHLPAKVERVLRRALQKRQSARYPTIVTFLRAFAAAAGHDEPEGGLLGA